MGLIIKENGLIIKCMVEAHSNGQMAEFMRVSIKMTENMVSVFSNGLKENSMKESGLMVNNME